MSDDENLMRIIVKDSWDFKFNPDRFLNVEIMAVEKNLGVTGMEWQDLLNRGSIGAATALLYIMIKRHENPQIVFSDIRFEASNLWVGGAAEKTPFDDPDPEGKDESGEPSPVTEYANAMTNTASDSSLTLTSGSDPGKPIVSNTESTSS